MERVDHSLTMKGPLIKQGLMCYVRNFVNIEVLVEELFEVMFHESRKKHCESWTPLQRKQWRKLRGILLNSGLD